MSRERGDVCRPLSGFLAREVDKCHKKDRHNETRYQNNCASGSPEACFVSVCVRFLRQRFSFRGGIGLMIRPKFFRVSLGRRRGRCVCLQLTVSVESMNVIAFLTGSAIIVVDTRTIMMPFNAFAPAAFSKVAFVILDAVCRIDTQDETRDKGKKKRERPTIHH